jgi:hypothetical protein
MVMIPVASIGLSDKLRLEFSSEAERSRAWEIGVFYLEAPDWLQLDCGREFVSELVDKSSQYRKVPRYGELEGFIALENNQQTKLALRRRRWNTHYPAAIRNLGEQLDRIGIAIVRDVLLRSGIPSKRWGEASGGYSSGGGDAFLNLVYYDVEKPDLGLNPHTDYGLVTILSTSGPGLEIFHGGKFIPVPVMKNHLIVNFGEALSFVTQRTQSAVSAVLHRVVRQQRSDLIRHSIVYFANPDLDGNLYQIGPNGDTQSSVSVQELFSSLEGRLTEQRT